MNRRSTLLALALAVTSAAFTPFSSVEAADVKGPNVRMVLYGQGNDATGMFAQTGSGTWIEHNRDGRFEFKEEGRDEWSVYLIKVGRQAGHRVQLDLHRRTVSTGDTVYYQILKAFK